MKTFKEAFGMRLKELRKERSWTQEEFAEMINNTPRHISRIEAGESFVSAETLTAILKILNLEFKVFADFEFDREITEFLSDSSENPSLTVIEEDDTAVIKIGNNKIFDAVKQPTRFHIDKCDEVMCRWALDIKQPINVTYIENKNRKCIKRHYPENKTEVLVSERDILLSKMMDEIKEELKPFASDIESLEYIMLSIKSLRSIDALKEMQSTLKGIELARKERKQAQSK